MKRSGRLISSSIALAVSLFLSCVASPPSPAKDSDEWWKHAIVYEIYPRSFADAKNTGMGNLKGITGKLDYLQELGIDAIWLTPCYPSPQVDFGYDISDYTAIAPEYGTMADFDELVAEAKKRNIRIVMDLVLNHTSDQHKWFIESKSSKDNPKRDWYIWRDGKDGKDGKNPPNNWLSVFGHSGWKFDETTKEWYYHRFYAEQPDLNWRNPDVRKAMYDVTKFWLDKGVAGFRLDAVSTLFEDVALTNNANQKGTNEYGDTNQDSEHNDYLPEVHDVMRELRAELDKYPDHRVLIGETFGKDISALSKMYGEKLDEVQLPMNFFFADLNKLSAPDFRREIKLADTNKAKGYPVYLFSNHDQVRHYVRYGDAKNNDLIAKLTATMLLTLRGTPLMYYGEEIGMENNDPKTKEEVKDPIGKLGWPQQKGRDGERTPMQWTSATNAGFSEHQTWLPIPESYKSHNVETESKDPNSILNYYKKMISLRRSLPALQNGNYLPLNETDAHVLSYLRKSSDDTSPSVLVALNMSNAERTVQFDLSKQGLSAVAAKTMIQSNVAEPEKVDLHKVVLKPYGVLVAELSTTK